MSRFAISLVNHAVVHNPQHWDRDVSKREARAVRKALQYRAAGKFAMLWRIDDEGVYTPVSLKPRTFKGPIKLHSGQVLVGVAMEGK